MKPMIIDPKTTRRAEAYELWMNAPNPMVTFFKTLDVTPLVGLILISNKMLYLKSRVFHTLVPHVPCVTPSHKNLTRLAL